MKKNITIIFLANFFTLLSGVVTSLLTAWALGPEGRGDLAVVVMYPNVVALIVAFGLPYAHRFYLARDAENASAYFSNAIVFAIVTGALAFLVAQFVVPSLVGERSEAVMWLLKIYLINIPFALLYELMAGMLEGSRQFKWAAVARIAFFGMQSVVYFLLWLTDHLTVYTATFTMIAAQLANTLTATCGVLHALRPRWKPSLYAWKKALGYGLKYHVGAVTSFTTLRLDQLMLGGMATSIEIGLYFIAVRLSEITTVLASSVAEVLMPEVAASKQTKDSIQLLLRSLRQMIYVYLLLLFPLLFAAPLILEYAFGAEFLAASGTLRLLLIASMIWSTGAIINSGLNGFGYPGLSTIARLASAIVTVFSLLYWLPKYGINGAALSSLLGYSVMFSVALFWLIRKKNISLAEVFRPRREDIPVKKIMSIFKSLLSSKSSANAKHSEENCFQQLFERQAAAHPDRTAIICNGKQLTYGELNARANQLAWHLRSRGAKPETLIPICVDRSENMAIGILGILKSGAAFVPIDPAYPAERAEFMLADTAAPFIVTQSAFLQSSETEKILLDADWEIIARQPTENLPPIADPENLAYVIYTSGSTGKPKGAMLTHANLYHYVEALQQEFHLTPDDKYLHLASIAFSSSRRHMLFPLAYGASVVIADEEHRMDPLPLFKLVREQKVTIFDSVPSFQRHCLNALLELEPEQRKNLLNNNLRLIVSASEPLLSDIPATWMFEFEHPAEHLHMIGQTETSGIISLNRILKEDVAGTVKAVSVGRPIANTKIYLLDENQKPVALGEAGEMYVCGKGLGRGYLNRPELTAQKFIEISINDDAETTSVQRVCRTGDFARLLPDGRLECLGRQDFQVKVRGHRVELGEIEALLISNSNVRECSVIGREDEPGQTRLVAYVVAKQKSDSLIEELRALAKEKLPDYMQPAAFVMLDSLPLTPNGKIDRKSLPIPDEAAFTDKKNYIAPRNATEQIIAEIWAEVLGLKRVGVNDNFFDFGGHSLLAGQVISRLRKAFNAEIPLRTIFEASNVAQLAEKIKFYQQKSNFFDSENVMRKVEKPEAVPLSFAQRRLWFLAQMETDSSTYNMCEVARLKGNLNADALRRALEKIVARHEILRTSFDSVAGEPRQIISSEAEIDFTVADVSDLPLELRETEALKIASEMENEPFDLSRCPLLCLKVIKVDEAEYFLVIVFHHIISDGWSVGVFLRELSALYEAQISDSVASLPELPIQYSDYALWQQKWLGTDEYKRQLEFWKEHLAGAPALLELPTDYQRPTFQRFRGAQRSAFLSKNLTEKINALSREEGATLFMTLLSAWQLLLWRYSGQEQIVVGTPIAGRTKTETENLIGFFVNTLALRGDLSGNLTFRELLRRNKERALGAYANQELPFEKLVEELNPERSLSYAPIFQVMFALQNSNSIGESFADLQLRRLRLPSKTAKFDLSLDIFEEAGGLELLMEYDTDLFAEETVKQMLGNFQMILEEIANAPQKQITDIEILTARERHQMLVEWNRFSAEVPPVCLHQLFESHAERAPEATAIVWKNERMSYGELNAKANQLANYLKKRGVKSETIVGVYIEKSFETIIGVLGVLKAGGAYLPLDPNYPAERLQYMVETAGISILLTQEKLRTQASEFAAKEIICLDTDWTTISQESMQNLESGAALDDLAYVIFTSGSTGKSKGVMITHRNVISAYAGWDDAYELSEIRAHIQMASFSFDVFTGDLTRALGSGAALVLCPSEFLLEPEKLYELMRNEKTECGDFVPAVMRPLIEYLEKTGRWLDFMKVVAVGADIWQMEEYRRLRRLCADDALVVNSYGITETTIDSTFFEPTEEDQKSEGIIPIGRPYANTHLYVLDASRNLVPARVPGELYIGGGGVGRGYLNQPELTKEKFIEWTPPSLDNFGENGKTKKLRLYKTGDLARYRHDGMVEILGRADYQVKIRGFRVELGEIEAVISQHPDVNECIVALREDVPGDKRLIAYITAKENEIDFSELRQYAKSILPEYMVPSGFVLVKEWKLTPNGKIDRKQLPAPDETFAEAEYTAPRNSVEEKLANIWSNLLRREQIGVNENFFDLGGHSLLAAQIVSRIRDAFGVNIPLRTLFETPTIADVAEQILKMGYLENDALIQSNSDFEELDFDSIEQQELESLLAELENVSDEEAQRILAGKNNSSYIQLGD